MARPRFIPNVEQRVMVRSMAAYGIRQEEIARHPARTLSQKIAAAVFLPAVAC